MKIPGLFVFAFLLIGGFPARTFAEPKDQKVAADAASPPRDLSKLESSVVGKWYLFGDPNRPAYFVNTDSRVFFINETKDSAEITEAGDNVLVASRAGLQFSLLVLGDYILSSHSFWCSRSPVAWSNKDITGKWVFDYKRMSRQFEFTKENTFQGQYPVSGNSFSGTWKTQGNDIVLVREGTDFGRVTLRPDGNADFRSGKYRMVGHRTK